VNVKTFKDIVQLGGFVNTRDLKNGAGDVAGDVAGGRDIRDKITVKE
jgi:osmotically-inducible protein OsmY